MIGEVGILNVGCGDTKLSFDPSNPAECIRAARIVRDMLKRGYALLVAAGKNAKGEDIYRRVRTFNPKTYEYIIADFDGETAAESDRREAGNEQSTKTQGRARGKTRALSAHTSKAVAVARTAGG